MAHFSSVDRALSVAKTETCRGGVTLVPVTTEPFVGPDLAPAATG